MRTRFQRSRAVIPFAALALLAAAPAPASAPRALDGYIITHRVVTDGAQAMSMTMRVKVAQGHVRLEMDSPEMTQMGSMYVLPRDDGKITAVMASQGMAITMDPSMLSGQAMGAFAPPTISDMAMTIDDLGAGERILGYATHKYRMHATYKTTSPATGESTMDTMMELSYSADVPGAADGIQKFSDSFGAAFGGLTGGSTKELSAAMVAKLPKGGYTLKAVIKSVETPASGQPKNSTTTIEVTEIAKASFEASEFEVPAGVQVMDLAQMMGGRGGR